MVVPGAVVDVGSQVATFTPHHHRRLGMGLEFDEAEHNLNAGAFQVACPLDILFLVKPGLELDHRHDRLAGFRRHDKRLDDRTLVGRSVKRLLDGHDVGVLGRLADELHHHVERLVGMMDDDVLLPDGGKAVSAMVTDTLRKARVVRRKFQLRTFIEDQLRRVGISHHAIATHHAGIVGTKLARHEMTQLFRAFAIDFKPHHRSPAAAFQGAFEIAHQVFGLFLDFDVAVAQHPEHPPALKLVTREKARREMDDHVLDLDETRDGLPLPHGPVIVGQPGETLQLLGHLHQRVHALAI